ncbi:MAG: hypothetical protein U0172_06205 [Nitrospiraceae bacterium]
MTRWGPLTFLIGGSIWLLVTACLGMALYIGIVRSSTLPANLRTLHAHGALIGGVFQLAFAAWLARRRSLAPVAARSGGKKARRVEPERPVGARPQWLAFFAINLGTLVMVLALWRLYLPLAGIAGLVAVSPLFGAAWDLIPLARRGALGNAWPTWLSIVLAAAFTTGCLVGAAASLHLIPLEWMLYTRLSHVLLLVIGCLVPLLTAVLVAALPHACGASFTAADGDRLGAIGMTTLAAGVAILFGGFALAQIPVQLGGGALLIGGLIVLFLGGLRRWLSASARTVGADCLLVSHGFLLLTALLGVLVGVNTWYEPHVFPFGTLHLIGYTHTTFLGALLTGILGACLTWLPDLLADRTASAKHRDEQRTAIAARLARGTGLTMGAVVLGTMALLAVSALTWQHPMGDPIVQTAAWVGIALLVIGLALSAFQLARAWSVASEDR